MAKKKMQKRTVAKASRVRALAKKRRAAASPRPAKKRAGVKASQASKAPARKSKASSKKALKASPVPAKKPTPKKAAKSPAAKTSSPQKSAAAKPRKPLAAVLRRRDGSGHLDPQYAADLRRQSGRPDDEGVGFFGSARSNDDLAEALGEQFVEAATTGEDAAEEMLDQQVPEERGGPFVRSNAGTEFAEGTDGSNPKGSKREPFPTT
jgi:hypothetical protein